MLMTPLDFSPINIHFKHIIFVSNLKGFYLYRRYTRFYGGLGSAAVAMARDALLSMQTIPSYFILHLTKVRNHHLSYDASLFLLLLDFPEWETQIEEWQAPILADTTLPEW